MSNSTVSRRRAKSLLKIGQIVIIDGNQVAQVIQRSGDALILSPLVDQDGDICNPSDHFSWNMNSDLDVLPVSYPVPMSRV